MKTFPDALMLREARENTPDYMHPSEMPWLVYDDEVLTDAQCDDILRELFAEVSYTFDHCNAHTIECPRPLSPALKPISDFVLEANQRWWKYNLGDEPAAWLQTYFAGDDYQTHMDGTIGQTRKLTAVAMLTDVTGYGGGNLEVHIPPHSLRIPKLRGSIVVFPHWVIHEVTPVTGGVRQTINLGYWGPPFA